MLFTWNQPQDGGNTGAAANSPYIDSLVWIFDDSPQALSDAVAQLKAKPAARRAVHLWNDNHKIFDRGSPTPLLMDAGIAEALKQSMIEARALPAVAAVVLDNEDLILYGAMTAEQRAWTENYTGLPSPTDDASWAAMNQACGDRCNQALRSGIFAPFRKYQPNAALSNFGAILSDRSNLLIDINNHSQLSSILAGNVQSPAFYGGGSNSNPSTLTAWGLTAFHLNTDRSCQRRTPGKVWPWYGPKSTAGTWGRSQYWDEFIRHSLLLNEINGLIFDPATPDAAPLFGATVDDTLRAQGGKLLAYLVSADAIDPAAEFFVTARTDDREFPTRIAGRVSFKTGVTIATFRVLGQSFTVRGDAGCAGNWFSWSSK